MSPPGHLFVNVSIGGMGGGGGGGVRGNRDSKVVPCMAYVCKLQIHYRISVLQMKLVWWDGGGQAVVSVVWCGLQ